MIFKLNPELFNTTFSKSEIFINKHLYINMYIQLSEALAYTYTFYKFKSQLFINFNLYLFTIKDFNFFLIKVIPVDDGLFLIIP